MTEAPAISAWSSLRYHAASRLKSCVIVGGLNTRSHVDPFVPAIFAQQSETPGLVVVSEEDLGKALLVHKIVRESIYQRSGEATIITWHDEGQETDIALSFQETTGCEQIWCATFANRTVICHLMYSSASLA